MRILIAEDDIISRLALVIILKKNGFEVVETKDGREAWEEFIKPDAPQLGIIDWIMPRMDGPELIKRVLGMKAKRPPYLIMLTARNNKADIITGLKAGADDYLPKPFDRDELLARVDVGRRLLKMRHALVESWEALEYQATHDALTGMLNRGAILDLLHKEIARADRKLNSLAVGIFDIDHFKQFNDRFGHQTGDDVIQGFSRVLTESLREYDVVGRLGGEEFLVIAPMRPGVRGSEIRAMFDRLRKIVAEKMIATRNGEMVVTASCGVALATSQATVDRMLDIADTALYRAKSEGRDRVIYDDSCFLGEEYSGPAPTGGGHRSRPHRGAGLPYRRLRRRQGHGHHRPVSLWRPDPQNRKPHKEQNPAPGPDEGGVRGHPGGVAGKNAACGFKCEKLAASYNPVCHVPMKIAKEPLHVLTLKHSTLLYLPS